MRSRKTDPILYRKLMMTDHAAFEAHLLGLDTESRRTRFGMAATDAFLRQYASRCITLNAIIHGAFDGEALVGVAELRPIGDFAVEEAELAFSVARGYRNGGIGTALFARTLRSARNLGFSRLYMTCLRNNAPMLALARKFAAEIAIERDETLALLATPRRTIISIMREALDDAAAYTSQALEWQRRTFALPKPARRRQATRPSAR